MKINRDAPLAGVIGACLLTLVIHLLWWGSIAFVAWHFIRKFW